MSWKKFGAMVLGASLSLGMLTACGSSKDGIKTDKDGKKVIETLKIAFVPSRDPDTIVTATKPLGDLLKKQLEKAGYKVNNVQITVGTTYEAVGESLESGTVDVGFIPGGTYVLYKDGAKVLLTATRNGLNNDSENPADWNKNKPTKMVDNQVDFYRAILVAGPTPKGQELAAKVNAGQKLAWEDLKSARIGVSSPTSSSGYLYPTLWMNENFQKTITDLGANAVQNDSYATGYARLAAGQIDAVWNYGDARLDYADKWTSDFKRTKPIWDETNVLAVTTKVFNDTISVSKKSKIMTDDFNKAFGQAMIDLAKTKEGKAVIKIYSHQGYVWADEKNYDAEAKVQKMVKELKR